jgi:hypothetical protein
MLYQDSIDTAICQFSKSSSLHIRAISFSALFAPTVLTNTPKRACEAGQKAGERENAIALSSHPGLLQRSTPFAISCPARGKVCNSCCDECELCPHSSQHELHLRSQPSIPNTISLLRWEEQPDCCCDSCGYSQQNT